MADLPPMPPKAHRCPLGDRRGVADGTLRRCATCGHWWRLAPAPTYAHLGLSDWFPVRWWNFRLRRYIRENATT